MGVQPIYVKDYGEKILKNANIVDKFGMYVPNHPSLTQDAIEHISSIVNNIIGEQE
tara:strand:- start:1270 stop:1437 length:168 start_codon:yes stop_codon:yes gene_type:complete